MIVLTGASETIMFRCRLLLFKIIFISMTNQEHSEMPKLYVLYYYFKSTYSDISYRGILRTCLDIWRVDVYFVFSTFILKNCAPWYTEADVERTKWHQIVWKIKKVGKCECEVLKDNTIVTDHLPIKIQVGREVVIEHKVKHGVGC